MKKNLYLLSQNTNNDCDTYDSMVVIADSKEESIKISIEEKGNWDWSDNNDGSNINVEFISEVDASTSYVLLASFNAG